MEIKAQRKKTGAEVTATVDIPGDLAGLVTKFGEESIYSHAKGSIVVALQGFMRGQLDRNKTADEITKAVAEWKPGQRKPGKTPQEKAREALAALSPEARAELLKGFRGKAAA